MCGLVGVAGSVTPKFEKVFKQLLVVDQLRGSHSTGIAAINANKQVRIAKEAMTPVDFFATKEAVDIFRSFNKCLIGHNRFATQGAVNGKNAHPFQKGEITGVHNGTLRNQSLLPDYKEYEVDSENIIHSLAKWGTDKTHRHLNGAFALVWYNQKENTLHFLRNAERPFHLCWTEDHKTIFWASEKWMLEGVLERNNVKHTDVVYTLTHREYIFVLPKAGDKIHFTIQPHTAYSCPIKNLAVWNSKKKVNQKESTLKLAKSQGLLNGSEITFTLKEPPLGTRSDFYGLTLHEGRKIEVFIHGGKESSLYDELRKEKGSFVGKVNGARRYNGKLMGLIVQANSIRQCN